MDDYVAARAETKHWQAVARELQAERDAVAADASLGLRAQNGRFASGLWDREKLGEVWRRDGEFVWVRVEGREWMREAREGFGRCGRRVVRRWGEWRERVMGKRERGFGRGKRVLRGVLGKEAKL